MRTNVHDKFHSSHKKMEHDCLAIISIINSYNFNFYLILPIK